MATPTNPFAVALEGHKEESEQQPTIAHSSQNNPFVTSTTSSSEFAPPAIQTNPFARASESTAPYSIQEEPMPTEQTQNHFESANDISHQLSGLDFTDPPAQSSGELPQTNFAPATSQYEHRELEKGQQTSMPESTLNQEPSMTTMYAPPPGPPPGHFGRDAYQETVERDPFSSQQQAPLSSQPPVASLPSETVPSQSESDEAFARRLLAEDEARVMQRRQQRNGPSNGAYSGQSSDVATGNNPTMGGGAFAAAVANPHPRDPNEEKQWNTKEIYWQGRLQRIVIQNENGPCSLIALCNVLLLRGTLQITPEDRPAVSYSYLSSLLGEHLIDVITTSGSNSAMDLEAALSILPQTQYGLDVNVCFSSIFGFSVDESSEVTSTSLIDMDGSSSTSAAMGGATALPNAEKEKQRGELALFKLCNVPLVHGWLADEDDKETWAAVVERSGDYDKALDRVVAGDELAKGTVVESRQDGQSGSGPSFAADSLSPQDSLLVNDAILIRNFLEATATQLTYPGLYALSTKLQRGVPYALFRNSHLSVLYRPSEEELRTASEAAQESTSAAAQPQLYQLVTDSTLENEDGIVWESVEDVDGSASRFFDAKFRQSTPPQDFIGNRSSSQGGRVDEDADFAYAQQLQDQESQRARRYQQQQGGNQRQSNRQQYGRPFGPPPVLGNNSSSSSSGGSNVISRMLANRKAGKRAPSSNARLESNIAETMGSSSTQPPQRNSNPLISMNGTEPGQEYTAKKDKWYKKIF